MREHETMTKNKIAENLVYTHPSDEKTTELVKVFSRLCDRLADSIVHRRVIQDTTLLAFNRITAAVINNSLNRRTDSYYELSRVVGNYRRYEFSKETNSERGCSYIRLFQLINLIETFDADNELKFEVHIEAKEDNNKTVVKRIYDSPGITYKKLKNITLDSSEKLSKQLQTLENKGYVFRRNFGKEQYYFLTNKGDVLYQDLFQEIYEWADNWSYKRIYVFTFLLSRLGENKSMLVQEILKSIILHSEENIENYYSQIKKIEKRERNENREDWTTNHKEAYIETKSLDFDILDFQD